jgi:hypothetical protein
MHVRLSCALVRIADGSLTCRAWKNEVVQRLYKYTSTHTGGRLAVSIQWDEVWRLGSSDSEEGKAIRIEDVPGGRREAAVRM